MTLNEELMMVCKTIDELCRENNCSTLQLIITLKNPAVKTVIMQQIDLVKPIKGGNKP